MNEKPHKVLGWRSPVDLIEKILLS